MTKITQYTSMTAAASNDVLPIVDVDNPAMAPSGTTMQIPVSVLLAGAASWLPGDNNLLGCNYPLPGVNQTGTLTKGTLYLAKLNIRAATTITNLQLIITTAGAGATTGCFTGLYSSAGTLLTGSADQAGGFTSFGYTYALTTPQALAAGTFVYAAVLCNLATTQITLQTSYGSTNNAFTANKGLAAAQFMFADNGLLLTALPATLTLASNDQANAIPFWCGWT